MVREISGAGGGQCHPQIKRVSVRSNGAGHANAGVVTGGAALPKAPVAIRDIVTISPRTPSGAKPAR